MTVSSDLNKISYAGNGTTTVFAVNYYFLADSHLQVVLITADGTETVQTLTTNYTVSGAGNPAGGSITMLVAPPTGTTVVIQREVPATQETDYLANDPFPAESHERALDKLTMLVQQNERENERALKIPLSAVPTTSTELPIPVGNKLLAWNSDASAVTNFDPSDVITIVGQQTSYGDVFTGNGVTTDFTLTRNPGSVFNIDVSINGVTQVPNVDYILNATTLTFTSAPPAVASQVLARYSEVFTLNDADAANVRYLPAGVGAQLTTVQAKLRETVSVKDFGAVGDGVTDDTAAFLAAIAHHNLTGDAIYVPPAVYEFGGNNWSNGGLTPGLDIGSVHLWANQDATLQNIGTAHFSGKIIISGLNFIDCVQPVYMSGNVDKLTVSKCSFTNFTRAIYHNDTTSGVYVKNVLVEDSTFENTSAINDFLGCILLHRASAVTDVLVQNNTMTDIVVSNAGTSIFSGFLAGSDTYPTTNYKRIRMIGNRITGCGNFHATTPIGASYGSYILAEDSEQSGNVVKGCAWINGLYMKGHGNTQAFNKVDAPQWGGVTMKTAQDTTSKNNVQVGNVVTGVCDRKAAIRMFGRGQSVDNQVDITVTGELHPTEGGFGFRATYSSTHGPLKVTGTYICERGIQITGAGDVTIDANITSNGKGIELLNSVDLFGTVIISGRVECVGQAVYLNAAERLDLRDFDFSSNLSGASEQAIFAYTTEAAVMSHVNGLITDTASDGLTLGYVLSLFAKTGGSLTNRFDGIDGVNIVTERNLSHVFRFFADAGVSGTGRLSFSDIDLDLQGNTCTSFLRLLTDPLYVSVDNVKVNGTLSRTIDGSGITVPDMIVSNGLMNYVATDNLASHTNATVTRSRIVNNKTA